MKMRSMIGIMVLCLLVITGCDKRGESHDKNKAMVLNLSHYDTAFFGDSTTVFIAKELQNGYHISIIHNKQINLIHFERGDSISQYCAIHTLPFECRLYEDSIGAFLMKIDFPICKLDTLDPSCPTMFFMDVNFDNEEEFIIAHQGYNREYYACFDLVKGNPKGSCPGLLESINEPPYDNLVGGRGHYTAFDYKKKEIHIYETLGCCSYCEKWAKYFEGDNYGHQPGVKVIKKVDYDLWADGTEHIETYKLVNDSLKLVENLVLSN